MLLAKLVSYGPLIGLYDASFSASPIMATNFVNCPDLANNHYIGLYSEMNPKCLNSWIISFHFYLSVIITHISACSVFFAIMNKCVSGVVYGFVLWQNLTRSLRFLRSASVPLLFVGTGEE